MLSGSDLPIFSLETVPGQDGLTTVSVSGELDLASAGEFSSAGRTALAKGAVAIDLQKVSFMDSAGVRALNAAVREAEEHGRQLRICGPMQPSVVQILELTGMMGLLPIEDRC